MSEKQHNFKEVDFGFVTCNGDEMVGLDCCIGDKNGCYIANVGYGNIFANESQQHEQRRANARRIAACINYCKNMTTEELEI